MYYYQDRANWESNLTREFVALHDHQLDEIFNLDRRDRIFVELNKKRYGKFGDADSAILKTTPSGQECIAIEIKVLHFNKSDEWKSEKRNKHHTPLERLVSEGWHYVYFFDFIVTEEHDSHFHPQTFEAYDRYTKIVQNDIVGHWVFEINPVIGKSERMPAELVRR
ncbi:MAG TPA: hypothetical protein VII11_01670 [Bacteroidota bacterium]